MAETGLAVAIVLFLWWFSTGVILYLDGLSRDTFRWSLAGSTVLAALSLAALAATRNDTSAFGAYAAFLAGLLVWAWNEILFLTGTVTGPRRTVAPERGNGFSRFIAAVETLLWHELLLIVSLVAVYLVTLNGANQVGFWTMAVLWIMRVSTKLNIYLGVLNVTEEFLPKDLKYIKTYFGRRQINLLFPFSVTASTVVTGWVAAFAAHGTATPFDSLALTLIATLLALGVLEHWLLVLPLPAADIWRWGLKSHLAHASTPAATVAVVAPVASGPPIGGES
jgi:putative photosynthetic complex assembly protein 2